MIEHSKASIGYQEEKAILKVIRNRIIFEGEVVKRFEEELSDFIGGKGAVATSTGTLALHLVLVGLGVDSNDEVITPNYVCRSVLNSILYCRAKPVLCDVNRDDYNISVKDAKKRLTRRTKAIIVPHMFGYPADIEEVKALGVPIIEDCAHAIGAEYKGRKVGSWGDAAIFSFEGTKYIITGEGGMILANSAALLKKLRRLKEPDMRNCKVKYTYRMTNLQAAIGRTQLAQLPVFIKKRREIARVYTEAFSRYPVGLPIEQPGRLHVFHRYMIRIGTDIKKFMKYCYRNDIKVKQPVKPFLLNQYLGMPGSDYPQSTSIMRSAASIPIYPSLTPQEIKHIINTVSSFLA